MCTAVLALCWCLPTRTTRKRRIPALYRSTFLPFLGIFVAGMLLAKQMPISLKGGVIKPA